MTVYTSFTGVQLSVRIIIGIALGCYVLAWLCLLGGLIWMVVSVGRYRRVHFWWVVRKGVPWLSPKILAIPLLLFGIALRAIWILLTLAGGPIELEYIFVNFGFIVMIMHLCLFLCFWADTLLHFMKKEYGMPRSDGFFNYHITRWTWVGTCVVLLIIELCFVIVFIVANNGSDIEEDNPGKVYSSNLYFFSAVLAIAIFCLLAFAGLLWKFILSSAHRDRLWGYAVKATALLSMLAILESAKLACILYKTTIPGYSSGGIPYEAYLLLVFFIPDIIPAFIFTFSELFSRRKIILREVDRMESRKQKTKGSQTSSRKKHTDVTSSSSYCSNGLESRSGSLDEPLLDLNLEAKNDRDV